MSNNYSNNDEELVLQKLQSPNEERNTKIETSKQNCSKNTNILLLLCVLVVFLGVVLEVRKLQSKNQSLNKDKTKRQPNKYWVYSAYNDVEDKNGLLKHVHLVLERIGYEKSTNETPWNLLWSHDYPFRSLFPNLHRLKHHQKVNHFPGTGFITNKVDFATTNSKYIPKAFKLPQNKEEFLEFASENNNLLFLEKNNQHRGVILKNVTEIDLTSGESFVQEYVQRPFLVDGHKFDIGVYVVLTSVDPLRIYWYKGDFLFRYCPAKYYPFDPKNLDKYVVGDDYLPTWKVPSLVYPYTVQGLGMKDSFDTYVRSRGKDPSRMWKDVEKAIAEVFIKKEHHIIEALTNYPATVNFFELMRFDLVVDEELRVFLLEANMSPNLSSAHYPPNQLLYEQVLYNLFSLTGVASHLNGYHSQTQREQTAVQNMVSSQKNIAVWGTECTTMCEDQCDGSVAVCALCRPCLAAKLRTAFLAAHTEHLHRGDFRRIFPPAMEQNQMNEEQMKNLTETNKLQYLFYQGKCNVDVTWCT